MKKCTKCGIEKEENKENFFWISRRGKFEAACRECRLIRLRELKKDKERIRIPYPCTRKQRPKNSEEYKRELRNRWLEKNREKVAQQRHALYLKTREKELERTRKWRKENPEKNKESHRKCVEKYPERRKARHFLNHAVEYKLITKPQKCEKCGIEGQIDGHHEDYSKPLEVQWLCKVCHGRLHRKKY